MASWEPIQSRVSSGTGLHLEMGGGNLLAGMGQSQLVNAMMYMF